MPNAGKQSKGLFRRRGSPYWWMRYADRDGRICRESTGTTKKKLARAILDKRRTMIAENKKLDVRRVPKTTFHELCDTYWQTRGKHHRMKGLRNMIDAWKIGFGNVPVKDLSAQKVERYLNDRMESEGLSPATRNRHLSMLKAMFNKGIEWELLLENPTTGIDKMTETGARTRFLDQDEIERLLVASGEAFRPILTIAIHTGMRRGEILGLRWPDVDLRERMVAVQNSKSGKKRMIPIDETLAEVLAASSSRFQKGYVFPSPRKPGSPYTDLNHTFRRIVDRVGIEDVRFHDLRHTFASHLVMNGVDIKTVQELLGHANLTMTMRYSHLAPVHRTRAVRILDTALRTDTKTDTLRMQSKMGLVSP